ncbi:hypothetical protein IGI65_001971 [Enterococcus sp. DIV0755b]|uniref:Bax inhibitor-1/YccA family protein n=1 Tax=Enterococcus sp. DIV0755b TaxID=2774657 RepID=UPI003F235526
MNNYQIPVVEKDTLNRFYAKVYAFFAVGLGISGLVSYLCATAFLPQTISFINGFPLGFLGLWIVQLILVFVLAAKARKNPAMTIAGFLVYSLLNGVTLTATLLYYDISTIYVAFGAATATFAATALFGVFTKKDLSIVGRIGFIALIGIIITMLLNGLILHSGPMEYLLSIVTVFVFAGLTAYDHQMIKKYYEQSRGTENTGIAVFVALQLYLDFINLLLAFLRIFGRD